MDAPTATEIRGWTKINLATAGFPDDDTTFDELVIRAAGYVVEVTGRPLDTMPTQYESLARECIQKRTEQIVLQAQESYLKSGADDISQTFSAGDVSQSNRSLDQYGKVVNPWPALHEILWRLMTPEKRAEFLLAASGEIVNEPYWEGTEVHWDTWGMPAGEGF